MSRKKQIEQELENIIGLATCDDALFHDGINLEIEACAKQALAILREKNGENGSF